MKKIASLIFLIPVFLFASIESSNPTPDELVKVLNYEAWKLELESLQNLEFEVEYHRYNEFKESVGGSTFGEEQKGNKEVYIVVHQDGRVLIRFFGEQMIGGAGGQFGNLYPNVSQSMMKVELPKKIEIGEKYPILESASEHAIVYFTIQSKQ